MAIRLGNRLSSLILVCCAGATLSGCARMGAMSRVDPLSVAIYPGGGNTSERPAGRGTPRDNCPLVAGVNSYSSGAVNLDCFLFPEDRARNASNLSDREQWNLPATDRGGAPSARSGTAETNAVRNATRLPHTTGPLAYSRAVASERERNRLTALLLKHSDDICVEEMGRLNSNESAVNTSLSILATAATTTANIVTGELAQSILTGVGTLSGSSRSHINAHVYRNTFAYAVSRAITIERQRLRALIDARRNDDTTMFTVDEAIRSANEYHGVCSFYKGLELVLASVEGDQRSRDAEARRSQIEGLEQQLRRLTDQLPGLLGTPAHAAAVSDIQEINDRIQALVLAGAPTRERDDDAEEEEEEEEDDDDAPVTPPVPTPAPAPAPTP